MLEMPRLHICIRNAQITEQLPAHMQDFEKHLTRSTHITSVPTSTSCTVNSSQGLPRTMCAWERMCNFIIFKKNLWI